MNVEDDPNTYRTPGLYDDPTVHQQSPLERLILSLFEKLKWELDDDIEITISGSQTSGIDQPEMIQPTETNDTDLQQGTTD
jgi:hypothetical protein